MGNTALLGLVALFTSKSHKERSQRVDQNTYMLDFVDWARRLLSSPDLAGYPLHLRLLIINGASDIISLRDFVSVRCW